MDISFILILPTATISTKLMREIFEGEIKLILQPSRIFYRLLGTDEDEGAPSSSSFGSAFFCWKINLEKDINYTVESTDPITGKVFNPWF